MAQIEIMMNFDVGKYGVGSKHETITDLSRYEILFGQFNYLFGIPQKKSSSPLNYVDYFLFNSYGQKRNRSDIDSIIRKEITSLDMPGEVEII